LGHLIFLSLRIKESLFHWGGFTLLLVLVASTSLHSYVLFHSLVEIFRIVVIFGIAVLAWNARRQIDSAFLLMAALAYPSIGVLELLHTLAYKGMGVFAADANLPTQLWIAFRGYESVVMLVAASRLGRQPLPVGGFTLGCLALGAVLGWVVLSGRFPDCYIEGLGLTDFKIAAEYVIAGLFAAALVLVWRRRDQVPGDILPLIGLALVCDILAELAFTQYVSVYGPANLLGHLLLLTSTYCLYRALLLQGIQKPQLLLFQQLNREKELLARSESELAAKVAARTAEVTERNRQLHEELAERRRVEQQLSESEEMLRLTRNVALDPMLVMDGEGRIVTWNPAATRLFGYEVEEAVGCNLHELLAPERDRAAAAAGMREFRRTGQGAVVGKALESVAKRRDGSELPVELAISSLFFRGAWYAVGIVHDLTERKEHQARIARLMRVYEVLSGINGAIVRIHQRQVLLDTACRIAVKAGQFGIAWIGKLEPQDGRLEPVASYGIELGALRELAVTIDSETATGPGILGEALQTQRTVFRNEIDVEFPVGPVRRKALEHGYRSLCVLPLVVDGASIGVMGLYAAEAGFFDTDEIRLLDELAADISFALQYIEREERLNYLAYYDALTGLPNRTLFLDRLTQFIHGVKDGKHSVALILLDLDRFARLNEVEGRHVGDAILKAVAERLAASVYEPCSLARIGADTFGVAMSGLRHGAEAAAIVQERIFDALGQPLVVEGREVHIAAHAGIALYPGDGDDGEALYQCAEAALKEAQSGGVRCLYYAPEINARTAALLALERDLRAALEAGQFVLHYQPRVDLRTGSIVGAEALIRWQHPARGLVPPAEFIPVTEQTGLIVPIGAWVIDTVCAQQIAWQAAALDVVPVAVNLSPVQFAHGTLLATLEAALARHGLDAKYLELELTESLVMQSPAEAALTMQGFRRCGLSLSLDDFGTGYSSLAYLQRFPFDFVKIDRAFVCDITQNPANAAIATAVIAMAHRLHLRVVAEGVETEGQLRYLRLHGCDQIQGFFFSPPVPTDAFAELLRSAKRLSFDTTHAATGAGTVLLVDDEPNVLAALQRVLRREGYRLLKAASGEEGLELLATNPVQVIVSDQRMPGMSGSDFLKIVKELYPDTIRIVLSGYTDLQVVTDAVNRGAVYKFLTKPWDDELLKEHIREAFLQHRLRSTHRTELSSDSAT